MTSSPIVIDVADGEHSGRAGNGVRHELAAAALRLFAQQGYDATTVDMIATAAGTTRRTFFRYFETKAGVLWHGFDAEIADLTRELTAMPPTMSVMTAVRQAVLAVNHYRRGDRAELRARLTLVTTVPELAASATAHYDTWAAVVSQFAARRCAVPPDSLYPQLVGRTALAACRTAFDRWVARPEVDLEHYLDTALRALATGFPDVVIVAEPPPLAR